MKENLISFKQLRSYEAPNADVIHIMSEKSILSGYREELGGLDGTDPGWDPED